MSNLDDIVVHPPGSGHPSLSEPGFDRAQFMGTWTVPWSTLPMWKDKRDISAEKYRTPADQHISDVTITYYPHPSRDDIFDSEVKYHKASSSINSKPSSVKGVEKLKKGTNGATFGWTGKGLLFFVSSHWQIIAYGQVGGYDWAVSYFSKTLFTPEGIDIYLRPSQAPTVKTMPKIERAQIIERISQEIQKVEGPVGELAKSGFQVPVTETA